MGSYMSEKAEQYINNQTARRVLLLIADDVKRLGIDSGLDDEAKEIIERIENVRKTLIGV